MGVVKRSATPGKKIGDRRGEELPTRSQGINSADMNYSVRKEIKTFDIERFKFEENEAEFIDSVKYLGITKDAFSRENDDGTNTLVIKVEVEDKKGSKENFFKFLKVEWQRSSMIFRFCNNMKAITEAGRIRLTELIDKNVVVTLYTNQKGKTYISTIFPVCDESEEDVEVENLNEDDTDNYKYDNDDSYNDGEDGGCIYES